MSILRMSLSYHPKIKSDARTKIFHCQKSENP